MPNTFIEEVIVHGYRMPIDQATLDNVSNFINTYMPPNISIPNIDMKNLIHVDQEQTNTFIFQTGDGPRMVVNLEEFKPRDMAMLRQIFTEASDSPRLNKGLLQAGGGNNTIYIHNDGKVHGWTPSGKLVEREFTGKNKGAHGVISEDLGSNGFAKPGTGIHISINTELNNKFKVLKDTVVHELLHLSITDMSKAAEERKVGNIVKSVTREVFDGIPENDYSIEIPTINVDLWGI